MSAPVLEYLLSADDPEGQSVLVEVRLTAAKTQTLCLRFANWTPGSYKMRDYARHVMQAQAWVDDQPCIPSKPTLDRYSVDVTASARVCFSFRLAADDDSVRGNWLDPWRGHMEGAALWPCVEGYGESAIRIEVRPPSNKAEWSLATSLPATQQDAAGWGWFAASAWRELIDHPLLMGQLKTLEFDAGRCRHRFAIAGAEDIAFDRERLKRDCKRICETQISAMDGTPNAEYLFLLRVGAAGDGGLEHSTSTLLGTAAASLPQTDADTSSHYERLLGLISHEYFHLWNVKRIRPAAVAASALDQPAPFPDLWAYEGVTAYVDDWFLRQSQTRRPADYLRVLGHSLTRLQRTPGRLRQSLVQASLDAWIRLYQPAPHLPHSTVSYYLKGALVALCLDILLRHHSPQGRGLIGVLAEQYQHWQDDPRPLPPHALEQRIQDTAGSQWDVAGFFSRHVYGCEDPDFRGILALAGLQALQRPACALDDPGGPAYAPLLQSHIGLRLDMRPAGLTVTLVEPESPARQIGVVPGDIILAVAGEQMTLDRLNHWLRCTPAGTVAQLTWLHDGRTRSAEMVLSPPVADRWEVAVNPQASDQETALQAAWLALPASTSR